LPSILTICTTICSLEPRSRLPGEAHEVIAHFFEFGALAVELKSLFLRAVEAERDLLERRIEHARAEFLVQKRAVGGKQRRDAMAMAELDALENVRVHERLAQPDQHHVLGGFSCLADETLEHLRRHIAFGLRMSFARAHRAVEIALGGGLDDVLHRQRVEPASARHVAPQ
jgi:hypothetical protein